MAGRYDFQSRFGGGEEPWFRLGSLDVNTVTAIVGMAVMQIMLRVFEGPSTPISKWFVMIPSSVTEGQIWRIVTWPIVNYLDGRGLIWTLLLIAVFWMLGSRLEGVIGRDRFVRYFALLILVPSVLLVVLSLALPLESIVMGLRYPELGILAAFAAQFRTARFWFGIPAPVIAGVFIGLQVIEDLADRHWAGLIMIISSVAVGLIGLRSMGHASDVEWIPQVRIPGLSDASASSSSSRTSTRRRQSRSSNRAGLRAVPTPTTAPAPTPESSAEIDALLDKIAATGYDSLSKPEKQRLEAHSKQMRRRDT